MTNIWRSSGVSREPVFWFESAAQAHLNILEGEHAFEVGGAA